MNNQSTIYKIQDTAPKQPKVALVHDWLIGGGAELVVEQLHKMFPEAPIYTSYCTDEWRERLDNKVVTGYLQRWPFPHLRKFIPFLRGWWFSRLKLSGYDLVISSSGAEAKFAKTDAVHISYIHAPTHYYWDKYEQYMSQPGFPNGFNWLARLGLRVFVGPMRRWDHRAAQRPDYLLANSTHTQKAIKKYYSRDSRVIHPPVDIELFAKHISPPEERKGFIIVGRQTPYKRFDLAVAACTRLSLPLVVIGDGPEHEKLKQMAGPSVNFTERIADHAEIARLVGSAKAFIFPGIDDFGVVSIEALAAGTPVIAHKNGGALDYIKAGRNGEFFEEQTLGSVASVLEAFSIADYQPKVVAESSKEFSPEKFQENLRRLIDSLSADKS